MKSYKWAMLLISMTISTSCAITLASPFQKGIVDLSSIVQIEVILEDDLKSNADTFWLQTQMEIKQKIQAMAENKRTKLEKSILESDLIPLIPRAFNQNVRDLEKKVTRKLKKIQMPTDNIPLNIVQNQYGQHLQVVIENFFMPFNNFKIWTFIKLFFITPPGIPLLYASEGRPGFVVFTAHYKICNQTFTILDKKKIDGASKSLLYDNITDEVTQRLETIFSDKNHPITLGMNDVNCS